MGFRKGTRRVESPCLGCNDRIVSCHSNCNKYVEYRQTLKSKADMAYSENPIDKYYIDVHLSRRQKFYDGHHMNKIATLKNEK